MADIGEGLRELRAVAIDLGAIVHGAGFAWIEPDGLAIILKRQVRFAKIPVNDPAPMIGFAVLRILRQGTVQRRQREFLAVRIARQLRQAV